MKKLKITLVGAGSVSFALETLHDIALSERFQTAVDLELVLMDIVEENVKRTFNYAQELFKTVARPPKVWMTTNLHEAVNQADFVITAIEVERNFYWSQDFHIPRRYGSKQIFAENGGPGSMFHTLRNLPPLLEIARKMEEVCPDAWIINYTNPEAKLVEAITKLTKIKIVGLCHGLHMGVEQLSEILEMDDDLIGVEGGGLNHFGFFTKIWNKETGEDLYPTFAQKEQQANRLAHFDEYFMSRMMYRLYGYYPYPGASHCGEYISYADDFYLGAKIRYAYDPLNEQPWKDGSSVPEWGRSFDQGLFETGQSYDEWIAEVATFKPENVEKSWEYAIPIIEAIIFDDPLEVPAVNLPNNGAIAGLPDDMVVETQAIADGNGLRFVPMTVPLPTAVIGTFHIQAMIHQLLIEAYLEGSKNKLLQAVLLDPNAPTYYQAAAMIDELCELQKAILPPLAWK